MFSFLGFIFFFVLIIIFFGLIIIGGVLRALFGFGKRNSSTRSTSNGKAYNSTHTHKKGNAQDTPKRKRLFDDDEGEYVEFEEVEKEDED